MKPFDLEKALAGEPVKLRNGLKAYVKYVMPEQYYNEDYPLRGFLINIKDCVSETAWTIEGIHSIFEENTNLDIISMWEEPRPRVLLELPCPLKKPQEDMFFIHPQCGVKKSWYSKESHEEWVATEGEYLENGLYFANREEAEEWFNAMKEARR